VKTDVHLIGMSNADAIIKAIRAYTGPIAFKYDRLNPKVDNGAFTKKRLNRAFFEDTVPLAKLVVLSLWGNWYNTLALVQHPEPFDFIYPSFDESVDENRRIIPFTQIHRTFANNIRQQLEIVGIFQSLATGQMLLLETPPPIEDENHILKYPGPFKEHLSQGVTPAAIRRKLWRLQSQIYQDVCRDRMIEFVNFPIEATSSGYLDPEYCFPDPTHANVKYGELILADVEARFRRLA
jgi:hypothetical protein